MTRRGEGGDEVSDPEWVLTVAQTLAASKAGGHLRRLRCFFSDLQCDFRASFLQSMPERSKPAS